MSDNTNMPKTTKCEWVIERHILIRIGLGLIIYTAIAEAVGFELENILDGADQKHTFAYRPGELAVLWTICCSLAGWIAIWRKRPLSRDARIWPILLVTLAAMAVPLAAGAYRTYVELIRPFLGIAMPSLAWPWLIAPLGLTVVLCAALWMQAIAWTRWIKAGICAQCGYDLTGNTSGRCPECGIQIDGEGGTSTRGMLKTAPEIRLFKTASDRDDALRSVAKELRKHPVTWVQTAAWITSMTLMMLDDWIEFNPIIWTAFGICAGIVGITIWWDFRETRKRLRQKLNESGIRVCMNCGEDLREVESEQCPNCEAAI